MHPKTVLPLLLERHRRGPLPLQEKNQAIPRNLARLIESCLAYDPDERPSAAALASALRHSQTPWNRFLHWVTSHRKLVAALIVLVLGASVGGATSLALREPYSVRQYLLGLRCFESEDYPGAIHHLDLAAESAPNEPRYLCLRGNAHHRLSQGATLAKNEKQHELILALADYAKAEKLMDDPQLFAWLGYCNSEIQEHKAADYYYERAIAAGLNSAAVYNNRACGSIKKDQLNEAADYLQKAHQLDRDSAIISKNRKLLLMKFLNQDKAVCGLVGASLPEALLLRQLAESPPSSLEWIDPLP
jgi:Flp pilus assembly protein TadD